MIPLLVDEAISNHGWSADPFILGLAFGATVGIVGALLMGVWEEVRDEREANEERGRGDAGDGTGQGGQRR